jgi:hypothetical protein
MFTAEVLPTQLRRQFSVSPAALFDVGKHLRQISTSKIVPRGEMIQERRTYEHDSVDYPNPAVDWCATNVALQFRLGILAKWRIRLDSFDSDYSRVDGKSLNELSSK